jgi:hypothetical protein
LGHHPAQRARNITTGSALTNDGERYIYAFQGGSRAFYRYDAVNQVWSDPAVADLPASRLSHGRRRVAGLPGWVYLRNHWRRQSNQFWRYDVAANTWSSDGEHLAARFSPGQPLLPTVRISTVCAAAAIKPSGASTVKWTNGSWLNPGKHWP